MKIRRVVTGHDARGKAIVLHDGAPPRTHHFVSHPGFSEALVWSTPPQPDVPSKGDPTESVTTYHPGPGESRFLVVTFPPDAVTQAEGFDLPAAVREHLQHSPGIADKMEPAHPGMHTTQTVDYVVLLEGELWLELDGGKQIRLEPHDIVIQNGTRHAWRNKGATGATILAVMIGTRRAEG
jgi:mannose-6-phosphate isomerase-like protein (cupin superfamily)